MMSDCIFCKIVRKEIPSEVVFEDEEFLCFKDIQPAAKTHLLVIPKKHVESLTSAFFEDGKDEGNLVAGLMRTGAILARDKSLFPDGFRSVINTGSGVGQTVFHLHLHLLGGEKLSHLL